MNYFNQRSTNAAAMKIENFRMQLRGVKDRIFFLFRLAKLFTKPSTFAVDPLFRNNKLCFI